MQYIICISFIIILPIICISTTKSLSKEIILMFSLYIINIINVIIYISKKFPEAKYLVEIKKLNGLYNFLNDFSNIKNLDIKYIEIYDKYYLYALGLGLTDEIERRYKFNSIDNNLKSNFKYLFYITEGENND